MSVKSTLEARNSKWNAGILATDISDNVLQLAREATYDEMQLKMLGQDVRKNISQSFRAGPSRFQGSQKNGQVGEIQPDERFFQVLSQIQYNFLPERHDLFQKR